MAFWRNYYHLVWATDKRELWILPQYENRIYACIVKKASELGVYVYVINGVADHVHLIVCIPPKHSVAWVVKCIKGNSSHFVNSVLQPPEFHFAWQRGYGCVTLGHTQRAAAIEYVLKQKEHHAQQTANDWLERAAEFDEGPAESPLRETAKPSSTNALREERVLYEVSAPFLF
ncbi:MAG: IS200/IS605 family transposase [Caldilineaceae bacterium]